MPRCITRLALGIIVSLAAASTLRSANKTWFAGASGDFGNPALWIGGGVPGSTDTATFDSIGTYTITFDNLPNSLVTPVVNQDLFFKTGTVTFTSGNDGTYEYWLAGSGGDDAVITGGTLMLGTSGHPLLMHVFDDLRIRGGAILASNFGSGIVTVDVVLGDSTAPTGNGTLIVDGLNSSLTVSGSTQLGAGGQTGLLVVRNGATADFNGILGLADASTSNFSNGILSVESGGALNTANIRIGTNAINGQTGTFSVGNAVGASIVTQDANTTIVVGATLGGPTPNSGTLNINSGGAFHSGGGTITVNPTGTINVNGGTLNANGNVTVNGGVVRRDLSGTLHLFASRTMTIQNGGLFDVVGSYGADAIFAVNGAGSTWTNSDHLSIGYLGTGRFTISAGGVVSDTEGHIGDVGTGSDGAVTVTGAGSTWTNTSWLYIGLGGTGSLTIADGGVVSNNVPGPSFGGYIGTNAGSHGAVAVTGTGSTWHNGSGVIVGNFGTGTLTIDDGGDVVTTGSAGSMVGAVAGSDGTVTVSGPGSTWTNASDLRIGFQGVGTVTIEDGGAVSSANGDLSPGVFGDAHVNVTGAGSTWTNSLDLTVGSRGTSLLTISTSGAVSNAVGRIGFGAGSDGSVFVAGAGSKWTNSSELHVGESGTGTLEITKGGAVYNTIGYIGMSAGSSGAVAVLGGNGGSAWNNSSALYIGSSGGGALTIANGGEVTNTIGFVGYNAIGTGDAIVAGAGSSWTNSSELYIGVAGSGTLAISAGGAVSNTNGIVGLFAGSVGTVTVTGPGSTWTSSSSLHIGESGTASLTVSAGGVVSNTVGSVGLFASGNGAVTVTGAGSAWTTSSLNVGGSQSQSGGTGALNVLNGGFVLASGNAFVWDNGAIDLQTGGTFNANGDVTIDAGVLTRAAAGNFNLAAGKTMMIRNGGRATFTGDYTTASNGMYNVTGSGSRLEAVAGTLSIINGAQVNVSSGASLFATATIQVGFSNGTDGTLVVDGTGSSVTTPGASAAIWGFGGATAIVTFQNNASGSFSQVSLAHSTTAGTTGIATIQSGADLTFTSNLALAALGGATTSATLSVQGSGSTVTQTGGSTLTVGHAATGVAAINIGTTSSGGLFTAGTGNTSINKTGIVTIGSGANTGTFSANGNVTIDGGLLQIGAGSSVIVAAAKSMTLVNSGTLKGSGNVTGSVINTSGVVEPGNSPGTLSITGNYTQAILGQLLTELASATTFDRLVATDSVTIAGILHVDLLGGFVPQIGNVFQIISSSGIVTGKFGSASLPTLTGANWQLRYNANSVLLQVALVGDYNFNGVVDAADYVVWRKSLGQVGVGLLADGNLNGQIDTGSGSESGAIANAAVPEPTTRVLLILSAASFCPWRRRNL
jgi:fibronectin-binding autotransporter adhesin